MNLAPPEIPGIDPHLNKIVELLLSKNPTLRADAKDIITLIDKSLPNISDHNPLPPLVINPANYHPATILKPNINTAESAQPDSSVQQKEDKQTRLRPSDSQKYKNSVGRSELPPLDEPTTATVLKPHAEPIMQFKEADQDTPTRKHVTFWKNNRRLILIAALSLVASLILTIGVWWLWVGANRNEYAGAQIVLKTSIEDKPLASGLIIKHQAQWNPEKQIITYTLDYHTVKNPISGSVLQSFVDLDGRCLKPNWNGTNQIVIKPHSPALSSINATCAWAITLPTITLNKPVNVTAILRPLKPPANQADFDNWMRHNNEHLLKVLSNPDVTSTAYPLQRLKAIRLNAPRRIKQGQPISITFTGIWPNGENTLTPIYTTPTTGEPTSMLIDITGANVNNLRLAERCSGAVVITPDGHDATALYPSTRCTMSAQIGNYQTDETPITIIGSGS